MAYDETRACSACRNWATILLIREQPAPAPDLYCSSCGAQEYETYHGINLELRERDRKRTLPVLFWFAYQGDKQAAVKKRLGLALGKLGRL